MMTEHIPITVTEKMTDMKKITGGADLTKRHTRQFRQT